MVVRQKILTEMKRTGESYPTLLRKWCIVLILSSSYDEVIYPSDFETEGHIVDEYVFRLPSEPRCLISH